MKLSWRTPGGLLAAVLLAIALSSFATLVVAQNVVWKPEEAWRYGEMDLPGTAVFDLPAGPIEIFAGRRSDQFRFPPHLTIKVTPVDAAVAEPVARRDIGATFTSSRDGKIDRTFARIWRVDLPQAGEYTVSVRGVEPKQRYWLSLGNGPAIEALRVWRVAIVAAAIAVVVFAASRAVVWWRSRRAANG